MPSKREELKYELLHDIKRLGFDGEHMSKCEGQSFRKHVCGGGIHLNEVIFTKGHFRGKPQKTKDYFADKRNCTNMCGNSHTDFGHSRDFRVWFQEHMIELYGIDAVTEFIDNAPLVIKK